MGDAINALFDLDENRRLICKGLVRFVAANAQFAAELDAVHFLLVTAEIGRVVVQAGQRVASVVVAVLVGNQVRAQRRFESFRLLQRNDVFEFKAIELADSVV